MNFRQFLEMLARLPARVWLQVALAIIGFVVLAVLGFAVIAGAAAIALVAILAFKAKAWIRDLFTGKSVAEPPQRQERKVIDVQYEIVERKDDERPR